MAALAERRGEVAQVEDWLNKAQDANPSAVQPGLLLSRFYIGQQEHIKALAVASDLAARFPDDPSVLEQYARAATLGDEIANAIRTFDRLIELRPDNAELHYLRGGALWKDGDLAGATDAFRRAIALRADYRDAKLALASVLVSNRDFDAAIEVARELQQAYPDEPLGFRVEGVVHQSARASRRPPSPPSARC
jgi:tetratricopeptide (TPR) repeat protein